MSWGKISIYINCPLYAFLNSANFIYTASQRKKCEENLLHKHLCEILLSTGEHFAYFPKILFR